MRVSTTHPQWPFTRQTAGSTGTWGNYRFHFNTDLKRADAWIIFDALLTSEECECPPSNVIFVTWESPSGVTYRPRFLQQFSHVITCHRNLEHPNIHLGLQGHPWHIDRDFDSLLATRSVPKSRDLCVISSDKQFLEGHRTRLAFVQRLKQIMGDRIDIFGRGINTFESKWETLVPYRYSIAVENESAPDWITEKLFDNYLTETFPIYFGAPNIHDYVKEDAIRLIDIREADQAVDTIMALISQPDHYESSLAAIEDAKRDYLMHLQTFPLMSKWLDSMRVQERAQAIRLFPQERYADSIRTRTKSRLRSLQERFHSH